MKLGDIFHTNGVVRKEEWRNDGDRNNRVYGMQIFGFAISELES